MEEELLPVEKVEAPQVNLKKASLQELKDTPITSTNVAAITSEMLKREGKVMIMITSTERDKSAVVVGLNGRLINIPRDKWFAVDKAYLEVLDQCKMTEYQVLMDPNKHEQAQIIPREVSRFAVSSKPVEVAPVVAPATVKK